MSTLGHGAVDRLGIALDDAGARRSWRRTPAAASRASAGQPAERWSRWSWRLRSWFGGYFEPTSCAAPPSSAAGRRIAAGSHAYTELAVGERAARDHDVAGCFRLRRCGASSRCQRSRLGDPLVGQHAAGERGGGVERVQRLAVVAELRVLARRAAARARSASSRSAAGARAGGGARGRAAARSRGRPGGPWRDRGRGSGRRPCPAATTARGPETSPRRRRRARRLAGRRSSSARR